MGFSPVYQPRIAAAAAGDQVPPHHSLNRDDAISTRSSQTRKVNYHCTYPKCSSGPWSGRTAKTDWERHERSVHWNDRRWMCMVCNTRRQLPQDEFTCKFCHTTFPDLEVAGQHTLHCEAARRRGKTFSRKDKLREHLRSKHNVQQIGPQQELWFHKVESSWPRQCGFGGIGFNEWRRRVEHVADGFSKGAMISDWRIPFVPKSEDRTFAVVGQNPKGDDGIDEDVHITFKTRWVFSVGVLLFDLRIETPRPPITLGSTEDTRENLRSMTSTSSSCKRKAR